MSDTLIFHADVRAALRQGSVALVEQVVSQSSIPLNREGLAKVAMTAPTKDAWVRLCELRPEVIPQKEAPAYLWHALEHHHLWMADWLASGTTLASDLKARPEDGYIYQVPQMSHAVRRKDADAVRWLLNPPKDFPAWIEPLTSPSVWGVLAHSDRSQVFIDKLMLLIKAGVSMPSRQEYGEINQISPLGQLVREYAQMCQSSDWASSSLIEYQRHAITVLWSPLIAAGNNPHVPLRGIETVLEVIQKTPLATFAHRLEREQSLADIRSNPIGRARCRA